MKFLVTGCAGFIGSHITDMLLLKNNFIRGIDSFTPYYSPAIKKANIELAKNNKNFHVLESDINSTDVSKLVSEVDYVIHEAAQPGVRNSWGSSFIDYLNENILATQKILEACKKKKEIKKIVIASSSSVYGSASNELLSETAATNPESPYGVTKLAMEKLALAYYRSFGLPIVLLRYFTVYGPRQRPDMAFHRFIDSMLKSKEIVVYGDGKQKRDFTYVEDICKATINSAENLESGSILNIGGNKSITILEVLEILEDLFGFKPKIKFQDPQKGDVRSTYANIEKAEKMINYKPTTNLKEGIKKEFQWLKDKMKK